MEVCVDTDGSMHMRVRDVDEAVLRSHRDAFGAVTTEERRVLAITVPRGFELPAIREPVLDADRSQRRRTGARTIEQRRDGHLHLCTLLWVHDLGKEEFLQRLGRRFL